jgi:hypothetical protein
MTEIAITPGLATGKSIKGDTTSFTLQIKLDGVAEDLTGSSLRMQLRNPTNNDVAVTLTSADAITISTTNATIDPTTINALAVGDYKFDIQWTDSSGAIRTVVNGIWQVLYEATED